MNMKKAAILAITIILLSLCRSMADKISPVAVRIDKGPVLDGYLTDEAWKKAIPFTDFKMVEPRPGSEPTEKTELRILYDDKNLYLGIYCEDKDVSKISANSMAHDDTEINDDVIKILLDPFQDKRNAYIFFVNPRSARSEGFAFGEEYSLNWDGIWDARSKILKDGWSVEIKIPFETISFNPQLNEWGLNVERYIPRKLERIRLSGTNLNNFFTNPSEAALMKGIEHIQQGRGITFKPYVTFSRHSDYENESSAQWKADGGFDFYKSIRPNFTGALSYNTDFAETEVDERQINLTRFPLYFPEKRSFFLEGSEIFSFGTGISETFIPFFSRTIGLYEGHQIPILFGAKVFGKLRNTNLAILDTQTKKSNGLTSQNLFAGRLYQNIFKESKAGFIVTHGNPAGTGSNDLLGFDFIYSTSRFRGDKNFLAGAWCAYNWNKQKSGKHQGFGLKIDYPNDLWDIVAVYRYFGDALNPGLGFLPRNNVQILDNGIAYQPRPEKGFLKNYIRQFFFELSSSIFWQLNGQLQTVEIFTAPLNFLTESDEHLEFNIISNRDVLPYDFEISDKVIIPSGAYNFTYYRFDFNSASHRPVQLDVEYSFGNFYSGHYSNPAIGLSFRYKGYATLQLNTSIVHGNLPQGKFNEKVYQLKLDLYLSPNIGLMNYIQYDNVSKQLGANIRFRWQIKPGTDLYFTYNKNWEKKWNPRIRYLPLEERGIFKFQISFRP